MLETFIYNLLTFMGEKEYSVLILPNVYAIFALNEWRIPICERIVNVTPLSIYSVTYFLGNIKTDNQHNKGVRWENGAYLHIDYNCMILCLGDAT